MENKRLRVSNKLLFERLALLEQLDRRTIDIEAKVDKHNGQIMDFKEAILKLPCAVHGERIKNVLSLHTETLENRRTKAIGRSQMMAALIGAGVSSLFWLISNYLA